MIHKSVATLRRELLEEIQTNGAQIAYNAALDVCQDSNATAQAKASASATILRAGGFLNPKAGAADEPELELHEMTREQLEAQVQRTGELIAAVEADLAANAAREYDAEETGGIFD